MFGQDEGHQCTPACTSYGVCSNMRDAVSILGKLNQAWSGGMNYIRSQCTAIGKGDIGDVLIDKMTEAVIPYADIDVKVSDKTSSKLAADLVGFTNELNNTLITVTVGFVFDEFFNLLAAVNKKMHTALMAAMPPSKITADEVNVTIGSIYTTFRTTIAADVKTVIAHVTTPTELNTVKSGIATYDRLIADGVESAAAVKEALFVVAGKIIKRKGGNETGCKGH